MSKDGCGYCAPIWSWANVIRKKRRPPKARGALASEPEKLKVLDEGIRDLHVGD
jgi:hypothetical protein